MLLSEIVNRVNSKSFGETTYTYTEIYPYFQQAIDNLNSQMDMYRHIPNAPIISEADPDFEKSDYQFLSDMHINNYLVTYIVVAMDNASLSSTSRTQVYATQLEAYTKRTLADLYSYMPVNGRASNLYFDFSGNKMSHLNEPTVKIWYDEYIGGKLSCLGDKAPNVEGIRWDNPYGFVILSPNFRNYKIKEGLNEIEYIFLPNDYFKNYYSGKRVIVPIIGYLIDYVPPVYEGGIIDIGTHTSLNELLMYAWARLKTGDGEPVVDGPTLVTGVYTYEDVPITLVIFQADTGLLYLNTQDKRYYRCSPVDLSQPTEFYVNMDEADISYANSPAIDSSSITIGTFTFGSTDIALRVPTNLITAPNKTTGKGYLVAVDGQGTPTNTYSNADVYIDGDTLHAKEINTIVIAPETNSLSAVGTVGNPFIEVNATNVNATSINAENFNYKSTSGKSLVEDTEITKLKGLPSQAALNRTIEDLQSQIDGINAGQNLADMVGTYADLTSYDKTNLNANDKIQVLVDEEHEGDSSAYKWDGTSFVYIGSYGSNSYTKAEVDQMHNELDERMIQHEADVEADVTAFKGEVNTTVTQNNTTVNNFRTEILAYVDESIGNIPALLDALIGTTEEV